MELFQKNMEMIRRADPALATRIEAHVAEFGLLRPERDEAGSWNVRFKEASGKERLFYEDAKASVSALKKRLDEQKTVQTVVLLGHGIGYHLNAILKTPFKGMRYLLIVEPSLPLFCVYLSIVDFEPFLANPRVIWIVGIPENQIEPALISLLDKPDFIGSAQNFVLIEWEYRNAYFEAFKKRWKSFQETIMTRVNLNPIDGYFGFMNFMNNWDLVPKTPHLQEFKGLFKGKPGIVVGSGPSLNLSLEWLKKIQDKAVIIAGSAYPILKKNGIACYMTCCLERDYYMADIFENIETDDSFLVTTPIVHRRVLDTFKGVPLFMGRPQHFLPAIFPDAEFVNSNLTSVSHVALHALWVMGCDPIHLVGQDLAADPKTRETHAANYYTAFPMDVLPTLGWKKCQVPSNHQDGRMMETWNEWHIFGKIFTELVHEYGIRCINVIPEEYGIRIEGTERADPDDVFGRWEKESIDVKGALDAALARFRSVRMEDWTKQAASFQANAASNVQGLVDRALAKMRELYEFYLNHPLSAGSQNQVSLYAGYFRKVEEEAKRMDSDPFFKKFLSSIVAGRHYRLMMQSYQLNGLNPEDPNVIQEKLMIPLYWYSEIVVRGRLVLRRMKDW